MSAISHQTTFAQAVAHHQAGRLAEAEQLYRQLLAEDPGHADALQFLGLVAHQAGRNDAALELIGRALELQPRSAGMWSNYGEVLRALNRTEEALVAYRRALGLDPGCAAALKNVGRALLMLRRWEDAAAACCRALAVDGDDPGVHADLGSVLMQLGRLEESLAAWERVVELEPANATACYQAGNVLVAQQRWEDAEEAYRRALALRPDYADAMVNLGNVCQRLGRVEEAIGIFRRVLGLQPDAPEVQSNLGNALMAAGRKEEAVAAFSRAAALKPGEAEFFNSLGNALASLRRWDQALVAFRQALALRPDFLKALNNLANALGDLGQVEESVELYRRALGLHPGAAGVHSNLLLSLHYLAECDSESLAREHRLWEPLHAASLPARWQPHQNPPDPERRLRIGYVSADLCEHPVSRFLLPLLVHHDRRAVEVFAYSNVSGPDSMTETLRSRCDVWRDLADLDDGAAAELVRADGIDVLVDLGGHTARHRLGVFARKPAPVQVTWLGYPDTTGLSAMDYRLTDCLADPPGATEPFHTESLLRLDGCAWCYQPAARPEPGTRPPGPVTFGCCNATAKVTMPMLRLWARILAAVPGARLLLKAAGWDHQAARRRVLETMAEAGIDPARVELFGWVQDYAGHLGWYGRVDIALDSFPYHGTTTTCDALWMGVPVVSLAGKTHVSRVGVSLLHNVGLPELVASTPEEYGRIAIDLARDLPRLAEIRSTLRARMEASPLMDGPRFAINVEAAYRDIWRRWCAGRRRGGGPAGASLPAADHKA